MNDASQPLQEFFAADPIPLKAQENEPKKERKKRTPRAEPKRAAPEEPKAPKKRGRKPKVVGQAPDFRVLHRELNAIKQRNGLSNPVKVNLGAAIAALAGLKPEEAQMVARAAQTLGTMPKRSRGRIVAALARMFA